MSYLYKQTPLDTANTYIELSPKDHTMVIVIVLPQISIDTTRMGLSLLKSKAELAAPTEPGGLQTTGLCISRILMQWSVSNNPYKSIS